MATDRMDKNAEGYADPTAGGAWNNIREKERRKEAARMTVISNLIPIVGEENIFRELPWDRKTWETKKQQEWLDRYYEEEEKE